MIEFEKIWIEQCEAARRIKEQFGTDKAVGYLIGEKLVNFIRVADTHPEFAREVTAFVAEVKRIFEQAEIRNYLENIRRVGALGHVATDEQYETFRAAGAVDENPVSGVQDVLIVGRIKEMLLE